MEIRQSSSRIAHVSRLPDHKSIQHAAQAVSAMTHAAGDGLDSLHNDTPHWQGTAKSTEGAESADGASAREGQLRALHVLLLGGSPGAARAGRRRRVGVRGRIRAKMMAKMRTVRQG